MLHCKSSRYVVTWKIGCSTFEQHEAKAYCNSLGMEPVSLDTPEKQNEFNRMIAQDAQRFFWTGGIVDHANRLVGWSNPASNTIRFSDSLHWSHTGGAGLPQPDNRAAGEQPPHPEVSLEVCHSLHGNVSHSRPASPSSTISMLTASSGTTLPVTTRSPPSASPPTERPQAGPRTVIVIYLHIYPSNYHNLSRQVLLLNVTQTINCYTVRYLLMDSTRVAQSVIFP